RSGVVGDPVVGDLDVVPQPCTKMPPPPWELSVMPRPSMADGLHQKLLRNGLVEFVLLVVQLPAVNSVVPAGKVPAAVGPTPNGSAPAGYFTPFASTVMAAPSHAPIRLGSCSSSARLPFCVTSQPITASSGSRSTWNCMAAEQVKALVGS